MSPEAKTELANSVMTALEIRNQSYNPDKVVGFSPYTGETYRGGYDVTFSDAADRADIDPDLKPLVSAMLSAGYVDFVEWAEKHASAGAA